MKFCCEGCKTVWTEKEVMRVEQYSKSAFCRVCSCKCNPLVDKTDLMRFFDMSEEDLEETPPEIPEEAKTEEKKEDELETPIKLTKFDLDFALNPADDEDPWDI
jgi:hypothetical protein